MSTESISEQQPVILKTQSNLSSIKYTVGWANSPYSKRNDDIVNECFPNHLISRFVNIPCPLVLQIWLHTIFSYWATLSKSRDYVTNLRSLQEHIIIIIIMVLFYLFNKNIKTTFIIVCDPEQITFRARSFMTPNKALWSYVNTCI